MVALSSLDERCNNEMEMETQQWLNDRSKRIRLLHERQDHELEQFDEESARLGFRTCPNCALPLPSPGCFPMGHHSMVGGPTHFGPRFTPNSIKLIFGGSSSKQYQ
uniref:Uncharacterized protein n=1 Tax=Timema tahoe TaxID=61484 RepID=A0A7R9IRY4_9NEOP|nr:unnamed protein product [Timema tahoe]